MNIIKNIKVPTGNICIVNGELNKNLEFLSLGDYGKSNNIKADFLGLKDEIHGVEHTELLPLEDKWVITISSQYGCSMGCTFCNVPKVGVGLNASLDDLVGQVITARSLHPEVTHGRINLHYARMGEPTWNKDVITSAYYLRGLLTPEFKFHPVVSTMMPKNNKILGNFLKDWLKYKRFANGDAGLQLSINTTDENARNVMFNGNCMSLEDISEMFYELLRSEEFLGRKIALNFALTGDTIDADKLRDLFSPRYFMCKITPIHDTTACRENGITADGYDTFDIYRKPENDLKNAGFDVIVFVPSKEEDESRITCGNAILSNT
jgi:23S rRNA (adenine2503-C2)-methyltransferase